MIYEKHDIQLRGTEWSCYTPTSKNQSGKMPADKGYAYIERITQESIQRYFVTQYRQNMQGIVIISIQENFEILNPPSRPVNGKPLPEFTIKERLFTTLFNLPTGTTGRGEHDGKFLIRALAEVAARVNHSVIPFDFNPATLTFSPIQPLVFTLSNTDLVIDTHVLDAENIQNVECRLMQAETEILPWQSVQPLLAPSTGTYTVEVKERESIILSQNITI